MAIRRLDSFEKFGDAYLLQLLEPPGVPEGTREFRILVIMADGSESIFGIYRYKPEHPPAPVMAFGRYIYVGPDAERRALHDWEIEHIRVKRFEDMDEHIKDQQDAADEKTPEISGKKAICSSCKAETDNYLRNRWWTSQATGEFVCQSCKKPGDFPHGLFLTLSPDEQVVMTGQVIKQRMDMLMNHEFMPEGQP